MRAPRGGAARYIGPMTVSEFIALWSSSGASERANKDSFVKDLADVLGVPHPAPCTGDRARDVYVFEADALVRHEGSVVSIGKMDLYKAGCFVLEAKQGSEAGALKLGTARRNTPSWAIAMQDAYGQALNYARTLDKPPPFLVVVDIGYCFDLYASFDGSGLYRPFKDGQSSRLFLADLPRHLDTLRAIWTNPHALDPARQKARVTREIAGHLAGLASTLEAAGHAPETVAKFLMRSLFTMFAEDVGLLREDLFTEALETRWCRDPASFPRKAEALWRTMNTGGDLFMAGRVLRFNGGLFADPQALPLDEAQLRTLLAAAKCSWADVEPAIFGTLLERALNPRERHSLGAHYTPREYVARLVKPTIEDPLRAEWDLVRVEARQLVGGGQVAAARDVVGEFHRQLCTLRVLDPACGTGNFLYVALDVFKRLESEVLALLSELGDTQAAFGLRVTPAQFLGIEVKPWAREIADLVLWLGFLSWNARITGRAAAREPVLERYGNIECRDALMEWDGLEPVLDETGRPVVRWDGTTTKLHPVTGKAVPDETKTVPMMRYVNPRPVAWPEADFIVGNPPFIGGWKIRQARGDGYVEALWSVYPTVPEKADYVMYWVEKAAAITRARGARRFGFITTNSIGQVFQRRVLAAHLDAEPPLRLVFAVPDHPWVQETDGAAVRIAMTVGEAAGGEASEPAVLATVTVEGDDPADVQLAERRVARIGADLRAGARVSDATVLRANDGVCSPGVQLYGAGFILDASEAPRLPGGGHDAGHHPPIPQRARPRGLLTRRVRHRLLRPDGGAGRGRAPGGLPARAPAGEARARPEPATRDPGDMVAFRLGAPQAPRGAGRPSPIHRDRRDREAPVLRVPGRGGAPGQQALGVWSLRRVRLGGALQSGSRDLGARCGWSHGSRKRPNLQQVHVLRPFPVPGTDGSPCRNGEGAG